MSSLLSKKVGHRKPDEVQEMWLMMFGASEEYGITDMLWPMDHHLNWFEPLLIKSNFDAFFLDDLQLYHWRRDGGWQGR